ncbi:MAG: hypothetical protein M3O50_05590 [Myxococcota bacterium]|nr:hypothetical protein [Myxococcota bacterium]
MTAPAEIDNSSTYMHLRWAAALAVALVAGLATARASAWQEAHQAGVDVSLRVDPRGVASLQMDLQWNVRRGPLKFVDIANVDPALVLDPQVTIATEDGRELSARAARKDGGTVRIAIDEPRAMMHGQFTFQLRGQLDLVASRALSHEGGTWRFAWSTPVAEDGFDRPRAVLDLPAAPDPPRPILPDTGMIDESVVATLQRGPSRDVLELVRPHVARGESVSWTIRIDPRALPLATEPGVARPPDGATSPEPDRVREVSLGAAIVGAGLAFGLLVAHQGRRFAVACAAHGARAQGLFPIPFFLRAPVAGASLVAALVLQLAALPTTSAVFVATAMLVTTLRVRRLAAAARGPGRWFALRPSDAFASPIETGHWLDGGSRTGRIVAMALAAGVAAAAAAASHWDVAGSWLVVIDSAPLFTLYVTGWISQLSPGGGRAFHWLATAFRQLRTSSALRAAPWARMLPDGSSIDELRLLVLPRTAMPGLIGLEIGLAWVKTPVGWAAAPEVLARFLEGSPAAVRLAQIAPDSRALLGRRPEERVVRLLPGAPTPSSTVALARAIADTLTDRRAAVSAEWALPDRRIARRPPSSADLDPQGRIVDGSCTASAAPAAAA